MRFTDRSINATQAARRFAEEAFDSPRAVNANTITGQWLNGTFRGAFKLCGGEQVYDLTCNGTTGEWEILARIMR